jgi:hypothetical protein
MARLWREGIGWLGSGAGMLTAFLVAQLVLVLVALPLWLRFLERRRWAGMRRALVREAWAAHEAATEGAAALSWYLMGEGPPLSRLQQVRRALAAQGAARERFVALMAVHSGAMSAPLAAVATGTIGFADDATEALGGLTRLYLKEARVLVAGNVVHGEDVLGFEPGQIVALDYVAELEALAAGFVAAEAADRARLGKAMGRRDGRERADAMAEAAGHAEVLAGQVKRLVSGLHAADPESPSYRTRKQGERSPRSLEGLIARFDRGGTLA